MQRDWVKARALLKEWMVGREPAKATAATGETPVRQSKVAVQYDKLQWLDLAFTKVADRGVARLDLGYLP